jgi:hypothetical protein
VPHGHGRAAVARYPPIGSIANFSRDYAPATGASIMNKMATRRRDGAGRTRFAIGLTILLAVGLLAVAVDISFHTVHRDGVDCGSVVKPIDVKADGPPGTTSRPCSGAHNAAAVIALVLVTAVVGPVIVHRRLRSQRFGGQHNVPAES